MPQPKILILLAILMVGLVCADTALAQQRSDTGRHKPVSAVVEAEPEFETISEADVGSWVFEVNGGLMGGGDLFNARHTSGDTIAWVPEGQGDWVSQRIRVGLENSFGMGLQVQRRMGKWYSLRAGVSYSRMDMNAEAPVGESAQVFLYDQADLLILSAGAEVRLTTLTESYPYVTGEVVYLDLAPDNSAFLSQSNLGGRVGFGYHHQFDPAWAFNLEIGLTRSALSSIYFPTPPTAEPENIEYENESHLSTFEAKFGIRLKI